MFFFPGSSLCAFFGTVRSIVLGVCLEAASAMRVSSIGLKMEVGA